MKITSWFSFTFLPWFSVIRRKYKSWNFFNFLPSVLSGTRACHLPVLSTLSCMTSAVAAQLSAPKNAYRAPLMVISKKRLRRYVTSWGRMAFATKYPNFYFFLFRNFLSSTCKPNFGRTVARKSSVGGLHVCAGGLNILKMYISFTTQHLQIA